jgi:hypothetical protein
MTQIKIYKKDVPANRPCHLWAEQNLGLTSLMSGLKSKHSGENFLRMKIDCDIDALHKKINDATNKYKWWGWINKNINTRHSEKNKVRTQQEGVDFLKRGSYYGGWSIKHNPIYCQSQGLQAEAGGMGELPSPISWFIFSNLGSEIYKSLEESQQLLPLTRIAVEQGYRAMIDRVVEYKLITQEQADNIKIPDNEKLSPFHKEKDSYFDTWSFTEWTDAAVESGIKDLTSNANCQVLRSRVAWQRGAFRDYRIQNRDYEGQNDRWTWHSDEPVCHNTRLIIPIQTSSAYGLEIKNKKVEVLEKGYAYTFNTNIVHRQIQINNDTKLDRIFIVLGFNPWFDWIPEEQAWASNQYYGKIHPLDMLTEGLILPSLTFDKELV